MKDSIANQLSPSEVDLGKHMQTNDVDRNVAHNLEKQLELMRKVCWAYTLLFLWLNLYKKKELIWNLLKY